MATENFEIAPTTTYEATPEGKRTCQKERTGPDCQFCAESKR